MEWRSDEIKALRRALGLSRREFAKKLRTSRVLVWYWETGKRSPSEESLSKLTRLAGENVNLNESFNEKYVNGESVNNGSVNKDSVNNSVNNGSVNNSEQNVTSENVTSDVTSEENAKKAEQSTKSEQELSQHREQEDTETTGNNSDRNNNTNNKGNQEISWVSNKNPAHEKLIGGYRETPKIILIQPHLSSTEKLLFTEILYYYRLSCERGYNFAIPSQETLANNLGVSQKTVRSASQNLVEHKLLQIETRNHIWGHKLQYSFPPTYPPQVFENYIKYERQNLKRLHDQNKPQEAIEQKQQLLHMLHVKEKEAQTQSYLKREDPTVLEAEDPTVLEAEDPTVLGTASGSSDSQPPDTEKSAPINKSSTYKSNNHHRTGNVYSTGTSQETEKSDDDDLNSKKQKDTSQTIQNTLEMSFSSGDKDQDNVSKQPEEVSGGSKANSPAADSPHPEPNSDTAPAGHHAAKPSSQALSLTKHIDDQLRLSGCQALAPSALAKFPHQLDEFLKQYEYEYITETIDEVIENLANSSGSKKISSANYFFSALKENKAFYSEQKRRSRREKSAVMRSLGGAK